MLAATALLVLQGHGAAAPPVSAEAREALAAVRVPDGFRVEVFASEPLLENPVALEVDERGAVYVAETFRLGAGVNDLRDHMDWLHEDLANRTVAERVAMQRRHAGEAFESLYGVETERVRLLRDTDGDGTADVATVFADGFDDPGAGLGAGVLARRGDLYYTCIPDLWLLRDRDGDGRADERRSLHTGFGVKTAMIGHDLHGPCVGPDGRLYFSSGDRGFRVETSEGLLDHSHAGAVLRCELDGSRLEVFHTGLRNPQELAFDDLGDLFTGDNNSDGGDRARWVHVVEGGDSGWRYGYQWITEPALRGPWNEERLWHPAHEGQAAYLVPPIANLGAGPSGLVHDPGTSLPPEWAGRFYLCDFRGDPTISGVLAFDLVPDGASWKLGEVRELAWGVLATDVDFGPDGALYLSDWITGWKTTGKGRVHRLWHEDAARAPIVAETRALLGDGLDALEVDELAALLDHADRRVRQEASFVLAERGDAGLERLAAATRDAATPFGRLHALWGLGLAGRRGASVLDAVRPSLDAPDAELRARAAELLGDARDVDSGPALVARLGDPSARVRYHAAQALGKLGERAAVGPLLALAAETGDGDRVLRHGVVLGLAGCAEPGELAAASGRPQPAARLAAVVALRRQGSALVAAFLADDDPLVVLEAARAIHDEPIPGALGELAALAERRDLAGDALVRRVLNANLRLGEEPHARRVAGLAARAELEPRHRAEALDVLADWAAPPGPDRVLGDWRPLGERPAGFVPGLAAEVADPMDGAPPEVARAWARLVARLGAREHAERLTAWALDGGREVPTRLAALEAVETLGAGDLEATLRALGADASGEVRAAALSATYRVAPQAVLPLLERALARGETSERRAAYRALGRLDDPRAETTLSTELERLEADRVPAELALDLVLAAEARGAPELDAVLERRRARRAADPLVAPFLDGLFGGDAARGRELFFEKAETLCVRCHPVEETDATYVGPGLAGLGTRRTRLAILTSIVDPDRDTTAGYESWRLVLDDGRVAAGRILEEDAETVRLQDADGSVRELWADEVVERSRAISSMPEDVAEHLSREDLRDLLAYLGSL